MILKILFPHLREPKHRKFFASYVLTFFGRVFIKGPTVDDYPKHIPMKVRQRLVDTHFDLPVARLPLTKIPEEWKIGQIKSTTIRNVAEEPIGSRGVFYISVAVVAAVLMLNGVISEASAELTERLDKRKAKAEAAALAEYRQDKESILARWKEQAEAYSPKQCIEEDRKLRVRTTEPDLDRYHVIRQACTQHEDEIERIALAMTEKECKKLASQVEDIEKKKGLLTWSDKTFLYECDDKLQSNAPTSPLITLPGL